MSTSTGASSLKARLKKLEDRVGKGRRNCAYCRLYRRSRWPDYTKPRARPEDFVYVECQFCHTRTAIHLGMYPEEDRESWRWWLCCTWEVNYLNSKAHALGLWLLHRLRLKQEQAGLAEWHWQLEQPAIVTGRSKSKTSGEQLLSKLQAEEKELFEKKRRMLSALYGPPRSAEQWELIESVCAKAKVKRGIGPYANYLSKLDIERANHMISAELEKIIWGDVLPQTKSAIEKLERKLDDLIRMKKAEETAAAEQASRAATVAKASAEAEGTTADQKESNEAEETGCQTEASVKRRRFLTSEELIRITAKRAQRDSNYYHKACLTDILRDHVPSPDPHKLSKPFKTFHSASAEPAGSAGVPDTSKRVGNRPEIRTRTERGHE